MRIMYNLNIEKIEKKKTKTVLTASFDTKEDFNQTPAEAFKRLLAIGVINGGSTNCIRQVLDSRLTRELNFEIFENLRIKADALIYEAIKEIERVEALEGIKTDTHKFI